MLERGLKFTQLASPDDADHLFVSQGSTEKVNPARIG
jgi:hypothetical protein